VTRAKPDGNTLLFATQGVLAMNPLIYTRATFDIERDLRPISLTYETDNVVVVGAASPYRSIADLVQGARAWPGAITMGSSGAGGGSHFYGELFQARAGVRFLHVPYRGAGPALTDLVAGKIDVMFDAMPSSSGFIKGGSLRPLAVTGPRRNVLLPEIPTVLEAGVPDYVAVAWGALMAPSGTPEPVCDRLAATLREALAAPSLSGRMTDLGGRTIPSGAGDVAARIRAEAAVWAALIREGRIMVEQ
jgi:tripartite-type tricarboxylate transporter receptor subunit TctC